MVVVLVVVLVVVVVVRGTGSTSVSSDRSGLVEYGFEKSSFGGRVWVRVIGL